MPQNFAKTLWTTSLFIFKIMKKQLICICIFVFTLLLWKHGCSQLNKLGGGIILATGNDYIYDNFSYFNQSLGVNIRTSYSLNKQIEIVPDLNIFLPNKEEFTLGGESKTTLIALNLNIHYTVNPRSNVKLYVLCGAFLEAWFIKDNHISSFETDHFNVDTQKIIPGANIGGGLQFKIGQKIDSFAEVKYTIAKTHQLVFTPGILYTF